MKKFSLLGILTVFLLLVVSGIASATPAYVMKGVPQDAGMLDKPYESYSETDCRGCHFITVDLHHLSQTALTSGCTACHKVDPTTGAVATPINRDCKTCHSSSWHHSSSAANAGNCVVCHEPSLLAQMGTGLNAPEAPNYPPSMVTPDPIDCANCHMEFNPAWDAYAPTGEDPNAVSHHYASSTCGFCHDGLGGAPPTVSAPIRMCESCHTISTLHQITGHTADANRCAGCHSDYMTGKEVPAPVTQAASISTIDKNNAKKYDYVILSGTGFGEGSDGQIYFRTHDSLGTPINNPASAAYWFDDEIQVMVPNITPGNYDIIVKRGTFESNAKLISVVAPPYIASMPPSGTAGAKITITGERFDLGTPSVIFKAAGKATAATTTMISGTELQAVIPAVTAGNYTVVVKTDVGESNPVSFVIGTTPKITTLSPNSTFAGRTVIIYGSGLALGSRPNVYFGTTAAAVKSYTATKVYTVVPAGLTKGQTYQVKLNNGFADSNTVNFKAK